MFRTTSHYGWKPDLPDQRDIKYTAVRRQELVSLPPNVDLTPGCPPVYDQGQLGSCTANAIAGAFEFVLMKEQAPVFMPSRLFIYFNERSIENSIATDSGAQIRDGMKSIGNLGVCTETDWPYIENEFAQKPFATCYASALNHTAISYQSVAQDLNQMKSCLAEGYPFVMGFTVYESFESATVASTGTLQMPVSGETVVGGHAVLVVGYDDAQSRFIVRNSWGAGWGMAGYYTMPYEYLTDEDLSSDFWTIRLTAVNPALQQPGGRGQASGLLPGFNLKE